MTIKTFEINEVLEAFFIREVPKEATKTCKGGYKTIVENFPGKYCLYSDYKNLQKAHKLAQDKIQQQDILITQLSNKLISTRKAIKIISDELDLERKK